MIEKSRILVSENQGKIHRGWALPPETSNAVEGAMRLLIQLEINEIRESIIARRRSDSFPSEEREYAMREHKDEEMLEEDT